MQSKDPAGEPDKPGTVPASSKRQYVAVLADSLHAQADDEISLADILRVVRRYRKVILGLIAAGIIVPAIAGVLMTPVYRAEVLVAPVTEEQDRSRFLAPMTEFGGFAALAGIDLQRGGHKDESIALLRSRLVAEQLIKDEKLRPVLFGETWNEDDPRWTAQGSDDEPTLADAYEVFDKQVRKIEEQRKTGLVVVAIEWEDPAVAVHWANELVRRTNDLLRNRATEDSRNAIGYLKDQLKQTSEVELQKVLHHLVESEMKQIILANINEEFAFRVIDPAVVPEKAFKPKIVMMVLLGAVAGLVAGLVLAFFMTSVQRPPAERV